MKSIVERGVLEVNKDLVRRWQLLSVSCVGRPDDFNECAVTETQCAHKFLVHLGDELLLCQVLGDLTRHQLRLLIVSEGEVFSNHLKLLLVDAAKVFELGAFAADRHITACVLC